MKAIMLVLGLMFSTTQVLACICTTEPIDSAYKHASTVFIGKVKEVVNEKLYFNQGEEAEIVIFEVQQGLKGSKAGEGPISVIDRVTSCSFSFQEGKTYVVFAYSNFQGIHLTNQCTRTGLLERYNKADMQRLNTISANYTSNYREAGIIQMLAPEYYDMVNRMGRLEKEKADFRTAVIVIGALLLVSIGINVYFLYRR